MTLTPRELDCLRAARDGLTVKETAHKIGISVDAVQRHRCHILAMLDVPTMTAAMAIAIRDGLISPPQKAVLTLPAFAGPR